MMRPDDDAADAGTRSGRAEMCPVGSEVEGAISDAHPLPHLPTAPGGRPWIRSRQRDSVAMLVMAMACGLPIMVMMPPVGRCYGRKGKQTKQAGGHDAHGRTMRAAVITSNAPSW